MTGLHMRGHRLTQCEFALQQTVKCFGNLLFALEADHLTLTYRVVFRLCELGNIEYLVLGNLNTDVLPFEEFSKGWLFDREV